MAISLPESNAFPDIEFIVCDYIDEKLAGVTPEIKAYTYLPGLTSSDLDDGKTFVLVQRVGGIAEYGNRSVDNAIIELTVLSSTRRDSWQVMNYLRDCMYQANSGLEISGNRVTHVSEMSGPSELLFADPKQRAVKFLFQIGIRRKMR